MLIPALAADSAAYFTYLEYAEGGANEEEALVKAFFAAYRAAVATGAPDPMRTAFRSTDLLPGRGNDPDYEPDYEPDYSDYDD